MLDSTSFDVNMLDKEASILVVNGDQHRFYTREELADVMELAKKVGTKYQVSDFKILHEDVSGKFGSITYNMAWKTSIGDKETTVRILAHEIWERQPSGWCRVFAALDATRI